MPNKLPILFTTKSCTQCQALKAQLALNNIEVEIIDAEEHPIKAAEYEVGFKVPHLVAENGDRFIGGGEGMRYISERLGGKR